MATRMGNIAQCGRHLVRAYEALSEAYDSDGPPTGMPDIDRILDDIDGLIADVNLLREADHA